MDAGARVRDSSPSSGDDCTRLRGVWALKLEASLGVLSRVPFVGLEVQVLVERLAPTRRRRILGLNDAAGVLAGRRNSVSLNSTKYLP